MKEIKRGDIYYAVLDPVVGSEQGGTRPVLILQNDTGNKFSPTTVVAAITGRQKKNLPTHVPVTVPVLPKDSIILLEQIRTIDKQRLCEQITRLTNAQMKKVEQAIEVSLGMAVLEGLK
jgi:mRNA interferase MazF